MSIHIVGQHVKVHTRLHQAARPTQILDLMESKWGRHHPLCSLTNLDELCKKTAVPNNKQIESALLTYVIDGIATCKLRGSLDMTCATKSGLIQVVAVLLLVRRIVFHLAQRFTPRVAQETVYKPNRNPLVVLYKVFGCWSTFHTEFPRGDRFDFLPGEVSESTSTTWIGDLPESTRMLVEFMLPLCDLRPDIFGVLKAAVAQNALVPAETVLAREDFTSIQVLSLETMAVTHRQEGMPVSLLENTQPTDGSSGHTDVTTHVPSEGTGGSGAEQVQEEEPVPEQDDRVSITAAIKQAFSHLVLPDVVVQKFSRVDVDTFSKMQNHAELRARLSAHIGCDRTVFAMYVSRTSVCVCVRVCAIAHGPCMAVTPYHT